MRALALCALSATLAACGFMPATPDEQLPAQVPSQWQHCDATPAVQTTAPACTGTGIHVDDGTALIGMLDDAALAVLWQTVDRNNYALAQTRMQVAVAAAQAGIDTAALWPQLGLGLQALRSGGEAVDEFTAYQAVASASWEVDLWGKLAAGKRASDYSLDSALAELEAARLSLAAQTARRWFDVIQAQQAAQLAVANRDAVENITRIVSSNYRRGLATLLDVRVAQSSLAQAISDAAAAEQTLASARQALLQLAGGGTDTPADTRAPATNRPLPANDAVLPAWLPALPARLPADVIRRRPDIVAAERRYRAAAETWQYARLSRLPSFTLTGDAAQTDDSLGDVFADGVYSWNVAAQLLAPVFDGGARRSRQQQAEALRIRELYGYGEVVFNAVLETNSRIEQLGLWQQRLSAAHNLQGATRSAEALALRDYRSGLSDLSVLLNARRDAIAADRALLATQSGALNNHIDLLLALGGVSAVATTETIAP